MDSFKQWEMQLVLQKIWNESTATKDLYYIVEYIPNPVDTSPWRDTKVRFEELDEKSQKILHEVRRYMELMESKRILLDLKPHNFRLDAAGNLYLVDFVEKLEESDFFACLSQAITQWSGFNQNICDFLKANLKNPDIQKMSCAPKIVPILYLSIPQVREF